MRVRLVPMDGGSPVEIEKDLIVVGRREDCDVLLDHKSISKQHCVIVKNDGLLLIRDLGSTNGTRVNGQRVRRAALLPNDQLFIASLRYTVQVAHDDEPLSPNEYTQQLDGRDLKKLIDQSERPGEIGDDSEADLPMVQANPLPDVYPQEPAKQK
ncbi:FHA domain-containing protein [Zavarzinella formosa]|uniref:FHA domain-containing protein n=1 Tax=Zavarzinella formosa TaxID=360055 RepID=UPI00037250AF|nr:FHA domain-containing protein [Zavarzinella formosa]